MVHKWVITQFLVGQRLGYANQRLDNLLWGGEGGTAAQITNVATLA